MSRSTVNKALNGAREISRAAVPEKAAELRCCAVCGPVPGSTT